MTATLPAAVPAGTASAGRGGTRSRPGPCLRTPPPLEPPYDDEVPPPAYPAGDLLPFEQPAHRRFDHVDVFDPQPTCRARLPRPGPWAAHFLQATLEAMSGRRPVDQLHRWATPPAMAGVASAIRRRPAPAAGAAPLRARPDRPVRTRPTSRASRLHSMRVTEPADGVAEVCAVVRQGARYRAVAARLEGLDGRWQCVTFRLL